jgi:hypothetical protein
VRVSCIIVDKEADTNIKENEQYPPTEKMKTANATQIVFGALGQVAIDRKKSIASKSKY